MRYSWKPSERSQTLPPRALPNPPISLATCQKVGFFFCRLSNSKPSLQLSPSPSLSRQMPLIQLRHPPLRALPVSRLILFSTYQPRRNVLYFLFLAIRVEVRLTQLSRSVTTQNLLEELSKESALVANSTWLELHGEKVDTKLLSKVSFLLLSLQKSTNILTPPSGLPFSLILGCVWWVGLFRLSCLAKKLFMP